LQRSSYREASRAAPSEAVRREMEIVLYDDLKNYLGSGVRSMEFIRKMKAAEA
jgi:hypothetical protein